MKVTYIYPNMSARKKSAKDALQPLSVAALIAHTPEDWAVTFYDDRIETVDTEQPTDLAVFSVLTFSAKRAYALAAVYRRKGVQVVMGGFHPTLLPEEASLHADCIVTGDAEGIWSDILNDAAAGQLKKRYDSGSCGDSSQIRFNRDYFKTEKYAPLIPVQISRGCRYSCDFCSVRSFYGSSRIMRKTEDVLEEIRLLPPKPLFFTDDNLFTAGDELPLFLAELKNLKRRWICQISIDASAETETLVKMKEAGCQAVFVGFESMNTDNLQKMGKSGNLRFRNYEAAVENFHKAGLMVCGSFVFGYDGDSGKTIAEAVDFALKNHLVLCHFNPLYPFPGTRVYKRLEEEGRLLYDRWWLDPDFRYGDPMFRPQDLGSRELTELCHKARLSFNSRRSILKRSFSNGVTFRSPLQTALALGANIISRREIIAKYGEQLG